MADTVLALNVGSSAVMDASGNATIRLSPISPTEKWDVKASTVSTSSDTTVPTVDIYLSFVSDGNRIDTTYTGSRDSSDTNYTVYPGQSVIAVFTGGVVGATAKFSVTGTKTIKGVRAY